VNFCDAVSIEHQREKNALQSPSHKKAHDLIAILFLKKLADTVDES
jgi:hypothetical protein